MTLRTVSLVLSSLALVSLCLNLYMRVSSAGEGLRCAADLSRFQREVKLLRSGVSLAEAELAALNGTIAGFHGESSVGRAGGRESEGWAVLLSNEGIADKIAELRQSNKEVEQYLARLREKVKTAEKGASERVKSGGKLIDEINELSELSRKLKSELKVATHDHDRAKSG